MTGRKESTPALNYGLAGKVTPGPKGQTTNYMSGGIGMQTDGIAGMRAAGARSKNSTAGGSREIIHRREFNSIQATGREVLAGVVQGRRSLHGHRVPSCRRGVPSCDRVLPALRGSPHSP